VVRRLIACRCQSRGRLCAQPCVLRDRLARCVAGGARPTLLLYRALYEAETMDIASRLSNARTMRVSGNDYFGIFLSLDIADEIERFVAGEEAPSVPESVLSTVIDVRWSSTRHRRSAGDRQRRPHARPRSANRHPRRVRTPRRQGRRARRQHRLSRGLHAGANEILVSQTVRELVAGSGIRFGDRGIQELKGIPGSWQLFAAADD
jgi:hypothetical protein